MNKKQITVMTILTLVLAFMDISGLPAVLFVHCSLTDVTPYIISLLVNFLIIGFLAWLVLKSFGKDWPLVILFKVISTIGMGLYFGAIYKRTNNLWVPIILHGFIDICALPYCFTTFSGYKTISLIGLVIIYTLLGIYSIVLMKLKKR